MKRRACVLLVGLCLTACAGLPRVAERGGPLAPRRPAAERWIEVDLTQQVVRLYEGANLLGEYPVATGRGDRPATLTYTGTFTVYAKHQPLTYLPDFDVYISDWVGFDREHAIGFHSLPKDKYGRILDGRLGQPVSHGCVRVGNSAAVYNFAQIGMRVVVR